MNLTFDPLFKAFMLSDNTKHYKAELFSLITGINEELFIDAKYTCEELKVNRDDEKIFRTDVIIKLNKVVISVEMNEKKKSWIMKRNLTYVSRLKGEELEKGKTYKDLALVIQINFNNFHISKDPRVIQKYMFLNTKTQELLTDDFVIYNIDLQNLKEKCYNKTRLENLLTLFVTNNIDNLKGDQNMNEAINEIERLKKEKDIIGLYDAKILEEKARNTDIEDALTEGIEQGIEQGTKRIAKNMLNNNFSINEISKLTGLSIEEIEKLKKA